MVDITSSALKSVKNQADNRSSVDVRDVAQFTALAHRWWDENGPFAPLHRINPVRLRYLQTMIANHGQRPVSGLSILDIGCGGGLVTEPFARLRARVVGVDAGAENIQAATIHAKQMGLTIDYRHATAEQLACENQRFDVVLALEILEHVQHVPDFVATCLSLAKPNGLVVFSTLNRTVKSFALGIVAAEYILRLLPAGTHKWHQFIRPSELAAMVRLQGATVCDITGMRFSPRNGEFILDADDVAVNYFMTVQNIIVD